MTEQERWQLFSGYNYVWQGCSRQQTEQEQEQFNILVIDKFDKVDVLGLTKTTC